MAKRTSKAQQVVEEDFQSTVTEPRLGRLLSATGFLLRKANLVFRLHYAKYFEDSGLGITPVTGGMLILISENQGISQIELARLLKIEGSTLWQSVTKLLELGYIDRVKDPNDKRAYCLKVSKSGRAALKATFVLMEKHQAALMSVLSTDEREVLVNMLQRIIAHGESIVYAPGDR